MCLFFLEDSMPLEAKEGYLLSSWSDSKWHTWATAKKFSILDLSSLHPYGKSYLEYVAQLRFMLLSDGAHSSATAHNCSATHRGGRTMSWTARLWFALARTSSRRRCTTGTRHLGTSCGGYDPGYPRQTTWAAPPGVA